MDTIRYIKINQSVLAEAAQLKQQIITSLAVFDLSPEQLMRIKEIITEQV